MTSNLVSTQSIDDTSRNISYAGTNWTHGVDVPAAYNLFNSTDSYSGEQGDSATLNFYGTAIEYWGNFYNTHGPCDIKLDGADLGPISAYSSARTDPQILFSKGGLELKDHVLVITVQNAALPNRCEIDRFVVNITSSDTGSSSSSTPTPVSKSKSSSAGTIAGGVVGGVALLALVILGIWWYRRPQREAAPTIEAYDPDAVIAIEKPPTPAAAPVSAKAAYIGAAAAASANAPVSLGESSRSPSGTETWRPSSDLDSSITPQAPFQVPVFQPPPPAYQEH